LGVRGAAITHVVVVFPLIVEVFVVSEYFGKWAIREYRLVALVVRHQTLIGVIE
jgi:hypothetical protein